MSPSQYWDVMTHFVLCIPVMISIPQVERNGLVSPIEPSMYDWPLSQIYSLSVLDGVFCLNLSSSGILAPPPAMDAHKVLPRCPSSPCPLGHTAVSKNTEILWGESSSLQSQHHAILF